MPGQGQGKGGDASHQHEAWAGGQYDPLGTGPNVLVTFAGVGGSLAGAAGWAKGLFEQKLKSFGVGHVYSVGFPAKGHAPPAKLVEHFQALVGAGGPHVFVAAHSSGSQVAHVFFKQLGKPILDTTTYYNVDGGYNEAKEGFPAKAAPKRIFAVYAESAKGAHPSRNPKPMKQFGFGSVLRKVSLPVPDKLVPKDATDGQELPAVAAYLHRRIIEKTPPVDAKTHWDYADKGQDVVIDWITDKDKDL